MIIVTNTLLAIIPILISVAFYTSTERKILSYIQLRKGPNKTSIVGILQPFADAIKLFNKTAFLPSSANVSLTFLSPCLMFFLSLIIWPILPLNSFNILDSPLNTLIFLAISSLSVYASMLIGWSANCKYSHMGAIRSAAQLISYEINFFFIVFLFLLFYHTLDMSKFHNSSHIPILIGTLPLLITWTLSCLAEVNRSPFDFAEAESELVSGFNVEFMGGLFALIFLAEYTNMLTLSTLSIILFLNLNSTCMLLIPLMASLLLWARGTLPRLRFDLLMKTNWQTIMPPLMTLIFPWMSFTFSYF